MAKLYSEKLNKYYDMSEADILAQEEAAYDAEMAAAEQKKADKEARLHEVEDAYDAAYEAYSKANKLKDEFIKDYGSIRIKKEYQGDGFTGGLIDLMSGMYSLFDL
jgi:pyruvate carboxylase